MINIPGVSRNAHETLRVSSPGHGGFAEITEGRESDVV